MDSGRISKDLLYGELAQGKRPRGRSQLQYKDICKRDLKALGMDLNSWETLTSDRTVWKQKTTGRGKEAGTETTKPEDWARNRIYLPPVR
ncbi:hypothetical protein JRQ81_010504 [Phrynocephalus forsythii]|uniref:Uncharacterized protein n=1 Tax=Phrynocephalus forsythii TaxID=171643 RepID=A0A9Q0Y0R3_9SAUR|nr:hypothetical protein JRQ81_010504 [Phrynocephalus forsythii]